ncbi:MAG: PHP-associated domain-containing protein [Longimicrobiales bacterium]
MHLHTAASFDCLADPLAVLAAARARDIDRICITDHNEISAAVVLRDRFPDRVIVGEEVKTAEGVDIIGLFLTERIPRGTPARETCERIHAQGGLVYVPHPFATGKGGGGRILSQIADRIDIVEALNARLHDRALNARAAAWARARGLPVGAGSDAHTVREVASAWVELPRFELTPPAFLASLQHASVHGTASSRLVHVASAYAKLRKKLGPSRVRV